MPFGSIDHDDSSSMAQQSPTLMSTTPPVHPPSPREALPHGPLQAAAVGELNATVSDSSSLSHYGWGSNAAGTPFLFHSPHDPHGALAASAAAAAAASRAARIPAAAAQAAAMAAAAVAAARSRISHSHTDVPEADGAISAKPPSTLHFFADAGQSMPVSASATFLAQNPAPSMPPLEETKMLLAQDPVPPVPPVLTPDPTARGVILKQQLEYRLLAEYVAGVVFAVCCIGIVLMWLTSTSTTAAEGEPPPSWKRLLSRVTGRKPLDYTAMSVPPDVSATPCHHSV